MSSLSVAFYGKIASARDFVRINAGGFQQAGWDAWFQEAMVELQGRALRLPSGPVSFILASGRGRVCAGAFAPSQDAHARCFPAVVSFEAPADSLADLAPWRHSRRWFFETAGLLARQAAQLTTYELAARLQSLGSQGDSASPHPDPLSGASLGELMTEEDAAALAYGLTTATAACAEARAAQPALPARALTLYLQATTEVQRHFWIALVGRHLGPSLPSLFWNEQTLALTLGPPNPGALTCLADPECGGPRCWPLCTPHLSARTAALAKLLPAQAHVLGSPGAPLAHVLSAFSREPQ